MSYRSFNAKAIRVFPFVIALMAIAVLLLPGDSVQAQEATTIVDYNENDDVPVITLTATDPEGASPIVWSLLTTDQGIQDIDGDGTDDDVEAADIADRALFDPRPTGSSISKMRRTTRVPATMNTMWWFRLPTARR